jgi:uncharacterized protein with HEPN domain
MRDDLERLKDILEAISQIEKYASKGRALLEEDELVQVWMAHHLRIIGEAARTLSEKTRNKIKEVPWKAIIGMRHYIVHEYFKVDCDAIWTSIEKDLPQLRKTLSKIEKEP